MDEIKIVKEEIITDKSKILTIWKNTSFSLINKKPITSIKIWAAIIETIYVDISLSLIIIDLNINFSDSLLKWSILFIDAFRELKINWILIIWSTLIF